MQAVLDEIWQRVVGGLDWLKQVVFGEFDDHRDVSAVVADMLVSFVPGVVIVTSARDLTAVLVRLARHPDKREQVEEWMLVIACAVPLVLPILAAAAGATAAGVGAVIGGIGGSEAGAALRAVCLLLIRQGTHALVEIVGFLRRFIKGDILAVLRDLRFARYGEALVKYIAEFIGNLTKVIGRVRAELLKLDSLHWLADVLQRLQELEHAFYGVQQSAIRAIPKALAELDARLQHALSQALRHEPRLAHAGIPAPRTTPLKMEPARVPAMSGNPLGHADNVHVAHPPAGVEKKPNLHPEDPHEPKLKVMKEAEVPCFSSANLPPAKAAEMERQLAGQQAGLNDMTVQQYLDGRQAFGDAIAAGLNPRGSGQPAADARAEYRESLTKGLREQFRSAGMSNADADRDAAAEAANQMRTLNALHNPDIFAGGANVIGDMGDSSVNKSIGAQWKGRVGDLDSAAKAVPASERATTRMSAKLERCR